jgi:hypothetical protein
VTRDPEASSRRALLARVLLFAAPLAILLPWTEARFRSIPSSHSRKAEDLHAKAPTIEVLVLGSSTAYEGVKPQLLRRPGYNAALAAQSLYYEDQILTKYLDAMKRLRVVLFFFDQRALKSTLPAADMQSRVRYERAFGIPPEAPGVDRFDLRVVSAFLDSSPSERIKCTFEPCAFEYPTILPDAYGWAPGLPSDIEDGPLWAAQDRTFMRDEILAPNLALLERDVAMLHARGVAVGLVMPPAWTTYRNVADLGEHAANVARLRSVAEGVHGLVHDYFADPRFERADFEDAIHLNATGAEKLSRILDEEVLGPLLEPMERADAEGHE